MNFTRFVEVRSFLIIRHHGSSAPQAVSICVAVPTTEGIIAIRNYIKTGCHDCLSDLLLQFL